MQDLKTENVSDANVFSIKLVLIQLRNTDNSIIWQNPVQSLTRLCRKLKYTKEIAEKSMKEVKNVERL